MPKLVVHQEKVNPENAEKLVSLCPFGAIEYTAGKIDVNAGCKLCGLCARKGPDGVMELVREDDVIAVDKNRWRGITVYAEISAATKHIHPVAFELLGKARELAGVTGHPVFALLIGSGLRKEAEKLISYGADRVYLFDDPALADFKMDAYINVFTRFINTVHPSSVMVGATNLGRSLAPRVAARFETGLTADCTRLEMKENTDLVQIRPAFGGNIMAQIVTPNTRPQFCTVRYKVFDAKKIKGHTGDIVELPVTDDLKTSVFSVKKVVKKPPETDISEADFIVAVGRGVKPGEDLEAVMAFADKLGAQIACTRPMVEAGLFDAKRQIGLSGRTVKPKLIITVGVSGAVQFAAGMNNSSRIIAINNDPNAPIFRVAHVGLVGDYKAILEKVGEVLK